MRVKPNDEKAADAFFHALADGTRRDILRRVLAGEHSVTALAERYPMTFAAVQKHVSVLERAGLVTKRRSGRESLASGEVAAVRAVAAMLAFSLSFDDFIITNFVSGDTSTFPKYVYVSYLRGIPAQANVIGFSLFVIAVLLVVVGQRVASVRADRS